MIPSGYDTIKLVDTAGELVKWTFVPPMRVRPDILVWGNRMFVPSGDPDGDRANIYREALHLHAVYISDKPTEIA